MIAPPVLAELRRPPTSFDEHYGVKFRHPLRKLAAFTLLEGPAAALRKSRSKLVERRIERAQELVIAAVQGSSRPLLAVTRDLGGALAFDPALVFAAREGPPDPGRVVLSTEARQLLEAYLPVPACPLALSLRDAILGANAWLEPAPADEARAPDAAAATPAATGTVPERARNRAGGRVYLVGCGGYVREQVLPRFHGLVAGAADPKAALILRFAAPRFPVWSDPARLLDAVSREEAPLVIVSSYHSDHAAHALAVLEANPGAHVFVEKPPVTTGADARALAVRRSAGAWIDVGYNRRYAPLLARLRGELPEPSRPWLLTMRVRELRIPASHWYNWPNQGTRITGNLCHWLDLAVHLLGRPREVSVVVGPGGEVVDVACEDGSVATISSTDRGDDLEGVSERLELFAGDRTVVLDDFRRLTVMADGRRRHTGGARRQKGHGPMYASLRDRWQNGGAPVYPESDLVAVADLVEGVARLYAEGGGRACLEPGQ